MFKAGSPEIINLNKKMNMSLRSTHCIGHCTKDIVIHTHSHKYVIITFTKEHSKIIKAMLTGK